MAAIEKYYAIRIGDFLEVRRVSGPLKIITSVLKRTVPGRKRKLTLKQVWYEGGKVLATWGWAQATSTFSGFEGLLEPDDYCELTKAQAAMLARKHKKEVRW